MRPTCRDSAAGTIVRRAAPALDTEYVNLGPGDKLHDWNPAGQHGSKDARFLTLDHYGVPASPCDLNQVVELRVIVPSYCSGKTCVTMCSTIRSDAGRLPTVGFFFGKNADHPTRMNSHYPPLAGLDFGGFIR